MTPGNITQKTEDVMVVETSKPAEWLGLLFGVSGLFCIGAYAAIVTPETGRIGGFVVAAILLIPASLVSISQNDRIRMDKKSKMLTRHEFFGRETVWSVEQIAGIVVSKLRFGMGTTAIAYEIALLFNNGRRQNIGIKPVLKAIAYAATVSEFLDIPIAITPDTSQIDNLNATIKEFPEILHLWVIRGDIHRSAKNFEQSLNDFSHVLSVNPQMAKAYCLRAMTFKTMKKYNEAIADFATAVSIEPHYQGALTLRGLCYFQMKEYSRAAADFSASLAIDEENPGVLNLLGNSLLYLSDRTEAGKHYAAAKLIAERRLKTNDKDTASMQHRGYALARLGNFEAAFEEFSKLLALQPRIAVAHVQMAEFYCLRSQKPGVSLESTKSDIEQALRLLERALELHYDPTNLIINDDFEILHSDERFKALCAKPVPAT